MEDREPIDQGMQVGVSGSGGGGVGVFMSGQYAGVS